MATREAIEDPTIEPVVERARSGRSMRTRERPAPAPMSGAVYGLGMIGALAYFMGTARTGQDRVLAVGKAVVWPALLVYLAFRRLGG